MRCFAFDQLFNEVRGRVADARSKREAREISLKRTNVELEKAFRAQGLPWVQYLRRRDE